jgi:hypothetical protein
MMIMKVTLQKLHANQMFSVQNDQRSEILYMADTVPANSSKLGKVAISNLGHAYCNFITGSFSTVAIVGGVPTDTGIDYLRGVLRDGNGNRQLFNDYIPFSLWLSPGRRKSLAASGDASNTLFYPIPFEYLFTANSDILLDVKNDSDVDQSYSIAFHIVRILAVSSVQGVKK